MDEISADPVHAALADLLGTSLRGVIRYDGEQVDYAIREDVERQYTEEGFRKLVDNSLLHQLDADEVEEAFRLGSLEAVVRVFERSWVVRVRDGATRGCLFSIERDDDVTLAVLEDAIATVEDTLGG